MSAAHFTKPGPLSVGAGCWSGATRYATYMADAGASSDGAFSLVVQDGSLDTLQLVLSQLSSRDLLSSTCPVSRGFAGCAEHILRVRCEALGWRQPKSSRLASSSDFPWRAVSQSEAPSPS